MVIEVIRRRVSRAGVVATLIGLLYAPARFALDFMRVEKVNEWGLHGDARYGGLTPAQYACIFLFVACVYLLLRKRPGAAGQHRPGRPAT